MQQNADEPASSGTPPRTVEEGLRVERLHQFGILDTPEDKIFQDIVAQALEAFPGASIAALSLIDTDRQWFKSVIGLPLRQTPRSQSFCSHTIQCEQSMIVENAAEDARFAENPLVTGEPGIRFYAGTKLTGGIGALCVIGKQPRNAEKGELAKLNRLAELANIQLFAHGVLHTLGR